MLAIGDRLGPGDVEQVDGFLHGFTLEKGLLRRTDHRRRCRRRRARGCLRAKRYGGLVVVAGGDAIGVGPFVSRDAEAITRPNREC